MRSEDRRQGMIRFGQPWLRNHFREFELDFRVFNLNISVGLQEAITL